MDRDVLTEHAQARRLNQRDIDGLLAEGVPPLALARSWCGDFAFIGKERAAFDDMGRFEFERHHPAGAVNVYTVLAFDTFGEPADIFAFRPGQHGLWLGAVDMLGQEQVLLPRIGDDALDVHADVVAWLRAERRGVVILNHKRAAGLLHLAPPLRVASVEHGRQLRHALTIDAPRIVVRLEPVAEHDHHGDFGAKLHEVRVG